MWPNGPAQAGRAAEQGKTERRDQAGPEAAGSAACSLPPPPHRQYANGKDTAGNASHQAADPMRLKLGPHAHEQREHDNADHESDNASGAQRFRLFLLVGIHFLSSGVTPNVLAQARRGRDVRT
jgi:hypothetical protein